MREKVIPARDSLCQDEEAGGAVPGAGVPAAVVAGQRPRAPLRSKGKPK
jgi:hypothetical protein